ncbi:tetratricopeptide repeat protein [Oscillatoria sp. FACHB-1407]
MMIWLSLTSNGLAQANPIEPDVPSDPAQTIVCEREPIANDIEMMAEACYRLGVGSIDRGRYEEAIAALTRAIELNPNDSDAYAWRAVAYDALNNVEAAIQDSREAVRLNADHVLSDWLSRQRPADEEDAYDLLSTGRRLCEPGNGLDNRSTGLGKLQAALDSYIRIRDEAGARQASEAIRLCRRRQT